MTPLAFHAVPGGGLGFRRVSHWILMGLGGMTYYFGQSFHHFWEILGSLILTEIFLEWGSIVPFNFPISSEIWSYFPDCTAATHFNR